jgi:hypothetical protein
MLLKYGLGYSLGDFFSRKTSGRPVVRRQRAKVDEQ